MTREEVWMRAVEAAVKNNAEMIPLGIKCDLPITQADSVLSEFDKRFPKQEEDCRNCKNIGSKCEGCRTKFVSRY